ncbi:MAG TPA: RidA family protein [Clostridiales bacterium]|nr:RidA family protein [Clostridiales bacterium]
MNIYDTMKQLGIELPTAPAALGLYSPVREFSEHLLYTSGILPMKDGKPAFIGKLGKDLTVEQGQEAARLSLLNLLSAVQAAIGDLSRIKRFVKILGFVACTSDFFDQPAVLNGASRLLIDLFGEEAGKAARAAVGVLALPGNSPVEIEAVIELY